jgi:hypothetical protein
MDELLSTLLGTPAPAPTAQPDLIAGINPRVALPPGEILFESKLAVRDSLDLRRIEALPRRAATVSAEAKPWLEQITDYMTARLVRHNPACQCAALGAVRPDGRPDCITRLLPIQAAYLFEAMQGGGVLGPIGVGAGKTGIDILIPMVVPDCRVAVLLLPPRLVPQLQHDYKLWSQHFKVPNLAGHPPFIADGRPVLELLTYSKLSHESSTIRLKELRPDVLIQDECHHNAGTRPNARPSTRRRRIDAFLAEFPKTRNFRHSGTMTIRSVHDYGHHAAQCLGQRSPLPLSEDALAEWAPALDPVPDGDEPAPMGELRRLCQLGETARQGFRRRLVETPGVVATEESALGTSLFFAERKIEQVPARVMQLMTQVRATNTRPDGEVFVEEKGGNLAKARCLHELSAGFYYVWYFPPINGEPQRVETIDRWMAARAGYRSELNVRLRVPVDGMDAPLLCWNAAVRWHDGYEWKDQHGHTHREPPHSRRGPLPVWEAEMFPAWRAVKSAVLYETIPQWVDDFLAADTVAWAREAPGIIWYDHDAFGRRVQELAGDSLPKFEGGDKDNERMIAEAGKRSVLVSSQAHGTGNRYLVRWSRSLLSNFPRKSPLEQVIGRTHRQGQYADEVVFEVYRHTEEYVNAWDRAVGQARYVDETQAAGLGKSQKLLIGAKEWE